MPRIRILSWNLLEGGHVLRSAAPCPDPLRMFAARQLIDQVDPHILVINEALWCQNWENQVFDYAAQFGFEHSHCQLYDKHWGNAILSKFPFKSTDRYTIYNRGGLSSCIDTSFGLIQVMTYHPHPSRWPHHKQEDFTSMAQSAIPEIPLVMCGDFNAISPSDNPSHELLTEAFSLFSSNPGPDSARFIESGQTVFPALNELGLRDALAENARPTMPTKMLRSHPNGGMRIDHAWVNGKTNVISAEVLVHPLADIASDHYPLVLELEV